MHRGLNVLRIPGLLKADCRYLRSRPTRTPPSSSECLYTHDEEQRKKFFTSWGVSRVIPSSKVPPA